MVLLVFFKTSNEQMMGIEGDCAVGINSPKLDIHNKSFHNSIHELKF